MIVGDKVGHRYAISTGQGTIGRDPSNAIQIIDEEVSRIHCRYQIVGDCLEVADLQSANGTFVNGKTVERCTLVDGDLVKIGSTVLEVKIEDPTAKTISQNDSSIQEKIAASESPSSLSYFRLFENHLAEGQADDMLSGAAGDPNPMAQVTKDMSFIYRASLMASSNAAPDKMLDPLIDLIFDWVAADQCCVLLRTNDNDQVTVRASRSRNLEADQSDLVFCQSVIDYVCEHRIGILTPNAQEDQRLSGNDVAEQRIAGLEAICVPINGRNKFRGVLYIDAVDPAGQPEAQTFNRNNLKLMIAIGRQIGCAIENEQYLLQLRERQLFVDIGQTTSSLTHHVKNVLQRIYGGSHLVRTGLQSEDIQTINTGWAIVDRNQQEISKIADNLLVIGNPYEPHLVQTDLNEVITNVFEEIGPSLTMRNIRYDWLPSPRPAIFRIDPRGIHLAIQNLINCCATACHGQTHGSIRVTVDCSSDENVVIAIADNSQPPETKNAEDPHSGAMSEPVHNMNAVELAVSRKLIRGHSGEVELERPESGGNLFCVRLPLKCLDLNSDNSESTS